ncbi:MAG: DUF2231 domain-containing protein [Janthinobacterium lividum]
MPESLDAAIGRIETAEFLDLPAHVLGRAISRTGQIGGKPTKTLANTLHGRPYGHPVHPLIVAVPIGTWTLALGLDLLGAVGLVRRRNAFPAADIALMAGSVGAAAAIATGLADWQHLNGRDRRVGLVHGSVNITATALNLWSSSLRRRGRRSAGVLVSVTAYACMSVGGYLGGHLVYRRRAAVDHADRSPVPREFTEVANLADLIDNKPHLVTVWDDVARADIGIALVRQGMRVHAMGARCSHAGGPLDQGWVLNGTLVCPWHGSQYDLETGQPSVGPSTCPQPRYEVRLRDGAVELRREQEPGDQVVTSTSLKSEPAAVRVSRPDDFPRSTPNGEPGRTATEVLFEHHELIRRLFERTLAMTGDSAERHDLMRTLAAELDIHEAVEDAIFYPAVRRVSEDTEIAYAEHGVLADLLAATVKFPLGSTEFQEHLTALQAAFLHHAGSEENSMFKEAGRLSIARLTELGAELDHMLDKERTSRARQAFRSLKIRLLERS